MAAPYKWYRPDASEGGDGDSYDTAYNNIVTAFAALSSTYYILNIVPSLSGVIPSAPIVLDGLRGAATTFFAEIRLTNSSGDKLPMTSRFIIDGNNSLLNCLQIINCTLVEISGFTFKRATQDNIQGLTTASTYIRFKDCDSMLAGRHGAYNIPQSAFGWEYYRGEYSNNVGRAITYLGSLNVVDLYGLLIKGNATVGNDYQVAIPSGSSLIDSIVKNGIKAIEVASANSLISNTIFDNHSVSTITNSTSVNKYSNLLIKNSPIGIVGGASNYKVNNITYYNVTNPRTATTGKSLIGTETIETIDPTDSTLNYKPSAKTRREIITMDGFYYGLTAGVPGSDVIYPPVATSSRIKKQSFKNY